MKKLFILALALVSFATVSAQTFTAGTLPGSYYSGGVTGVWDMNNDGLNDIVVMDQSKTLRVLYQQANGSFVQVNTGTQLGSSQWGMSIADLDNDGFGDVISGGAYDNLHYYNIDGAGAAVETTLPVGIFTQACTMGDLDNDGWLDFFACHDDGPSNMWRNDGAGNMVHKNTIMTDAAGNTVLDYNLYAGNYPGTNDPLMSGNYGNEFSDFDRDGDLDLIVAKCRQASNDPLDKRRTNLLFVNDGNNVFHEDAAARGLVNLQQSWTATFGDIDNDGDFDCLMTTHSSTLKIYENNGLGYFTDITPTSGLQNVSGFFMQGQMTDFDNDGFIDVVYAGGAFGYYRNNGDHTFTSQTSSFNNPQTMHGFGLGDLNNDGFVDVYAGYGNSNGYVTPSNVADRLQINGGNNNHWVGFHLEGVMSNTNAVGAIVEIHGAWGTQVREVRSGVSYGITNSNILNFGIGSETSIDYAIIHWPAGGTKVITNPAIDQYHSFVEVDCAAPVASITANGATSLCVGESVTLSGTVSSGNIIWSTGATTNSINVNSTGTYTAVAYNPVNGCASVSNAITVSIITLVQVPTILVNGDLEFCQGNSVELVASEGLNYLWSNGQTTQSINAVLPGDYTVQVEGGCGFQTSTATTVVVHSVPSAPFASDVMIPALGLSAELSAIGSNLVWYDNAIGGSPIATGSTYTTPAITTSPVSYWVEDVATFGGAEGNGGKATYTAASGAYFANTPTNFNKFDALEDVILDSVYVYSNAEGVRTIEVVDANLIVIATADVNIPNGESFINLNFFVPAGNGYGLRTTTANPGLWRDRDVTVASPYQFPYDVSGLISITGTTVTNNNQNQDGDNYYYFFYDWHAHTPSFDCPSPRTEVQVMIIPGCNDPLACDYNPTDVSATTCHYPGCTNLLACNYNSNAGCEDGSCYFINGSCNDNDSNTILDSYNSNCNCIGLTYAYGTISTETNNLCPDVSNYVITTNSAPSGMVNYSYQWYFKTGNNAAPAGSSTLGWNMISGATASSLTVDAFTGTRTYACFVTPDASYGISGNWMEGAKVLSYISFAAQTIIGNPNIVPFTSYNYLVNPAPGHTFNWTVVNGAIASGQGTNVTSIIWGQNGPYQLTLTESDGTCTGSSYLFAVNNNCSISVSAASASTNSFCAGTTLQLQAATSATGITYQWYQNGVVIPNETNQTISVSSGGNYQVSINQNGCTAVSNIVSITELPSAIIPSILVEQANAGCASSDATLTVSGGNYTNLLWNNGLTANSISVNTSGDYSITAIDENGCAVSAGPVSVNFSILDPVPVCMVTVDQVTGKNNVVWEPITSDLINSYVILKETNVANEYAQVGTVAYGSNGLFEDVNSNPQVQANRYKLALIDTCGILSSNSDFHKTIHLSTNQGLGNNVNLIWSGYEGFDFGSYNIYRGASAGTMTLLTTIASNLDSYTDINPPVGEVYYMIEVEGVSCDPQRTLVYSHSNVITTTTDGVDELSYAINLYPNPATTSINLQVNSTLIGQEYVVFDAVGKVIYKNKIQSTNAIIQIENFNNGNYFVKVNEVVKRFVVQH